MEIVELENKINQIRRQIVEAQVKSEDTSSLQRQLREAKLELETAQECVELSKLATRRVEWKSRSKELAEGIATQRENVRHYLDLCHSLATLLKPIIEQAKDLRPAEANAYQPYPDLSYFSALCRMVSADFLPDLTFPQVALPHRDSHGLSAEIIFQLQAVYGYLSNLSINEALILKYPVDEGLGPVTLTAVSEIEPDIEDEPSCIICQGSNRAAIDADLNAKMPLRELEKKYGISRSTLSRHKQHSALSQENVSPLIGRDND